MACRTLLLALVYFELLAVFIVLGLVQTALKRRQDALERLVDAPPRKDEIVVETVHQLLAE